ncbi:MAG: hypothetical protein RIT38_209 [Bacteroidota bacterium]|jgi:hypothetical protein
MKIPERKNIEVYLNGECKNFNFIGSYKSDYGPMGVEHVNLHFPSFIHEIESWNEIKEDLNPADLINHFLNIKWMDESRFLENYGVAFHTNYQKAKKEIEKLNLIIEDELDGANEQNILYVTKGSSINFDCDFDWSAGNEWARRDADFIVLFEEGLIEEHSIFLFEDVYDEVIDLLGNIWEILLTQY